MTETVEQTQVETTIQEEKEVEEVQNGDVQDGDDNEETKKGKASRGEKKFKKSLVKMGMKQVEGVNRVTLKTTKNFVLYIDDPDILKSTESAYVIFGEAKFLDFTGNLANDKAQNFQKAEDAQEM